jgi:uncharacterized SAM-binding protein YcdF (DUF218 family)
MSWFATNVASAFLLPPFNLILLGMLGVLLLRCKPGLGKAMVVAALALLYLLSIPLVADALLRTLEPAPSRNSLDKDIQAIVVLGGGTYYNAPEYHGDTVGRFSLERVRYAAWLHQQMGKPILATGGDPADHGSAEAAQMKAVLEREFTVPVKWIETVARNTRENAYNSFAMLQKEGIGRIALVTHAWHMPRAAREFEQAGFKISPAATGYTTRHRTDIFVLIPSAAALQKSSLFFHEVIGIGWYWLTS